MKNNTSALTQTALMTAIICVLAPLSIPIGPVPISMATFVLFLSIYILGWKLATSSCILYILLGTVGVPVFSGYAGGLGKIMGPTGGYIIGFIPMVIIAGILISKTKNRGFQFLAMVLGLIVCYAFGTAWFCISMESKLAPALMACVVPFIPVDLIKILITVVVGPMISDRLIKARVMHAQEKSK